MTDFSGTKVALINKDKVLVILRDDKPDISFPGYWDMPGGKRDNQETPMEVAVREVDEELSLKLNQKELIWQGVFPAVTDPTQKAVFMVFAITGEQIKHIKFGDEGREWKMVTFEEFLSNNKAIPGMQDRLRAYLATIDQE